MKNKKAIAVIIAVLACWAFSFLCFTFVLLEINPIEWSRSARSLYVLIDLAILLIAYPIIQMIELNNELKNK